VRDAGAAGVVGSGGLGAAVVAGAVVAGAVVAAAVVAAAVVAAAGPATRAIISDRTSGCRDRRSPHGSGTGGSGAADPSSSAMVVMAAHDRTPTR
jgi:hypothetical protein